VAYTPSCSSAAAEALPASTDHVPNDSFPDDKELEAALERAQKDSRVVRNLVVRCTQRRMQHNLFGLKAPAPQILVDEGFEREMRNDALDYAGADLDDDNKLDFDEFCAMVAMREPGEPHDDEELWRRFTELDEDSSGKVDVEEYIRWTLRDVLGRSSQRVLGLFRQWDEDGLGTIERKEFWRGLNALGFDMFPPKEVDLLFDSIDANRSGTISFLELNQLLQPPKHQLRDASGKIKTEKEQRFDVRRVRSKQSVLPPTVHIKPTAWTSVARQLQRVLRENAVRVIDVFKEWDEDGDGLVSKREFRRAIAALGYEASRAEMDEVFESFDEDGSGMIEYGMYRAIGHV